MVEVTLGVVVAREDMKIIPVDLDVSSDCNVSGVDEVVVLVNVLILSPLQELALHYARVLLRRLEDLNGVVAEEETHDESPVNILRDAGVKSGSETKYLFVVVYVLEEVTLWLVGKELIHVS